MKKMVAALLVACVFCVGLVGCAGTPKEIPPYFPYNENLRLDATKEEIIAAEKLVAKDDRNFRYHRPETVLFQGLKYTADFYFDPSPNSENGYINILTVKESEDFEKEYNKLVKYFCTMYGTPETTDTSNTETEKNTSWHFNIDTGSEYVLGLTTYIEEDSQKYCIGIAITRIKPE